MDTPQVPTPQPTTQENPVSSVLQTPTDQVAQQPPTPVVSQPPVQEAAATLTAPAKKSHTVLWVVLLIIVVAITAGLVYVVYGMNNPATPQSQNSVQPAVDQMQKSVSVTPAPQSESQEVDQIDTTYPTSDVTSIENDVKSL